jgi:hypothetical protein
MGMCFGGRNLGLATCGIQGSGITLRAAHRICRISCFGGRNLGLATCGIQGSGITLPPAHRICRISCFGGRNHGSRTGMVSHLVNGILKLQRKFQESTVKMGMGSQHSLTWQRLHGRLIVSHGIWVCSFTICPCGAPGPDLPLTLCYTEIVFGLNLLLTGFSTVSFALVFVIEPDLLLTRFYKNCFELDALLTVNAVLQSHNHDCSFCCY